MDGNLCRCTGYRPIFDAFKSLANVDNPIPDIEDMRKCPINKNGSRGIGKIKSSIDGVDWYMPTTVNDLMTVLAQLAPETTYRYIFIDTLTNFRLKCIKIMTSKSGFLSKLCYCDNITFYACKIIKGTSGFNLKKTNFFTRWRQHPKNN